MRDQRLPRTGGAKDDVGPLEQGGELGQVHRHSRHLAGDLLRPAGAAIGDEELARRAPVQFARGELGHLSRSDEQHGAAGEIAEHLAGELDGHAGHRDGAASDLRLGAHSLRGRLRPGHEAREIRAGGAVLLRGLVRLLDLAEDLRFPDDHRVEARRHAEEVREGFVLAAHHGMRRAGRTDLADQIVGDRARIGDREDLQAVAGRDEERLAHAGNRLQPPQSLRQIVRGYGHLLAHGDCDLAMGKSDAE